MPIYEFICQNCGIEFERILSFSDTSAPDCPKCASSQVTRQVGRPAIHFKGSGWYITDSKKAAQKSGDGERKNGSDESASETKGETDKADAKADASSGDSAKSESGKSSGESERSKSTESTSATSSKSDS